MSKAFIRSLGGAIKKARAAQELVMRQKPINDDLNEVIENLDSIINVLYGLQEEEREIAQFENNFLESPFDENDELEEDDELER